MTVHKPCGIYQTHLVNEMTIASTPLSAQVRVIGSIMDIYTR